MDSARMTRRRMIQGALALSAAAFAADPLAAYAASESSSASDADARGAGSSIRMINYAGWMGATELADFKKASGTSVSQIVINEDQGRVAKLGADPKAADMCLGDLTDAGRLAQLGVLGKLDWKKIPNYAKYVKASLSGLSLGPPKLVTVQSLLILAMYEWGNRKGYDAR